MNRKLVSAVEYNLGFPPSPFLYLFEQEPITCRWLHLSHIEKRRPVICVLVVSLGVRILFPKNAHSASSGDSFRFVASSSEFSAKDRYTHRDSIIALAA